MQELLVLQTWTEYLLSFKTATFCLDFLLFAVVFSRDCCCNLQVELFLYFLTFIYKFANIWNLSQFLYARRKIRQSITLIHYQSHYSLLFILRLQLPKRIFHINFHENLWKNGLKHLTL